MRKLRRPYEHLTLSFWRTERFQRLSLFSGLSRSRVVTQDRTTGIVRCCEHIPFQRIMYNRLLFHCVQLAVDVIFAAVSNQCPQETTRLGKLFPPSMLQQKVSQSTKRGVF